MQELAVLAARSLGMQKQFTAIADNVANASTNGYKRLDVSFKEIVSRPRGQATASYVTDSGPTVDYAQGTFETTHNPLDLALGGDGFFAVQTGNGVQYTRRGNFLLNNEGQLVTTDGNAVLDNSNAPIQVPDGVKQIAISSDGSISTEQGQLAQVGVFTFDKAGMAQLQRAGHSNFAAPAGVQATTVETPTIKQGMLESSNVNAIQETVTMEQVSQAYQNSLKLLKSMEDTETTAIHTLGGTSN